MFPYLGEEIVVSPNLHLFVRKRVNNRQPSAVRTNLNLNRLVIQPSVRQVPNPIDVNIPIGAHCFK